MLFSIFFFLFMFSSFLLIYIVHLIPLFLEGDLEFLGCRLRSHSNSCCWGVGIIGTLLLSELLSLLLQHLWSFCFVYHLLCNYIYDWYKWEKKKKRERGEYLREIHVVERWRRLVMCFHLLYLCSLHQHLCSLVSCTLQYVHSGCKRKKKQNKTRKKNKLEENIARWRWDVEREEAGEM